MYDICSAVLAINPNAQVSVTGEDYDKIIWHGDTTPISKDEIQAKQEELKNNHNSNQYQRDRKPEYGTWEEQLDMMFHNMDDWRAHVQAIKDKYPKP